MAGKIILRSVYLDQVQHTAKDNVSACDLVQDLTDITTSCLRYDAYEHFDCSSVRISRLVKCDLNVKVPT